MGKKRTPPKERVNMKKLFLAAAAAVLMTGCMKLDMDVEPRKDGTASMAFTYAVNSQYASEEDMADGEHEIQHFNVDGTDYIGYTDSTTYNRSDELTKDMTSVSEDGATMFSSAKAEKKTGLFKNTYVFDAVTENLAGEETEAEEGDEDYSAMMADMIKASFSVTMPGKVTVYSGGTLEGNKVSFNLIANQINTYHVESSELNVVNICICVIVLIVVAAIAIYLLTKGKKPAADGFDAAYASSDGGTFGSQTPAQDSFTSAQDRPVQDAFQAAEAPQEKADGTDEDSPLL